MPSWVAVKGAVAIGVLCATLCACPAAAAELRWSQPEALSPPGFHQPVAAIDGNGNAAVAFSGDLLSVATRPAGGRFSAPVGLASGVAALSGPLRPTR